MVKGKPGEEGERGFPGFKGGGEGGKGGRGGEGGEGAVAQGFPRAIIAAAVIAVGVIVTLLLFVHRQSEANFRRVGVAIEEARIAADAAVLSATNAATAAERVRMVLARQQNQAQRIKQLIDALKEAGVPVPESLPNSTGNSSNKPPKGGTQPPPGVQPPGGGSSNPGPSPSPSPTPGPTPSPTLCVPVLNVCL